MIRVQPDEGVTIRFGSKVPGTGMEIRDVNMDFVYGGSFTESSPEAYERLILDVLLGDPPLFPRHEEVELSWKILDPVLDFWERKGEAGGLPVRAPGARSRRTKMLARDGRDLEATLMTSSEALMLTLSDTDSAGIAAEFVRARMRAGSPAMGMVLTMVIVVDEDEADTAMEMAREASHEHPARVLGRDPRRRPGRRRRSTPRSAPAPGWTGETALIRLTGEVVKHPDSVVLPLLLPDSPVAVWWPTDAPGRPGRATRSGQLAQRRITDSANVTPRRSRPRCATSARPTRPGNTDLAWTRLTPWRALLAAALDQHPLKVTGGHRHRRAGQPAAPTCSRRGCATGSRSRSSRKTSKGPGITEVEMETVEGPIRIARPDGRLATYSSPGQPDRPVALRRRDVHELLAEELRRLDEDDVYAAVAKTLTRSRSL